jgi:hypothetical protein
LAFTKVSMGCAFLLSLKNVSSFLTSQYIGCVIEHTSFSAKLEYISLETK